jgi:hypothetical protein
MGFTMKPSASILSPFSRYSDEVCSSEVRITLMSLRTWFFLICLHASMPEISGSTTFSRTISGRWAWTFSMPSEPVWASSASYPAPLRTVEVRRFCSWSSSITSIFILLPMLSPPTDSVYAGNWVESIFLQKLQIPLWKERVPYSGHLLPFESCYEK